jgi:cytochrome c553
MSAAPFAAACRALALALASVALSSPALAQQAPLQQASPQSGQQLATSGGNGVTACVACHGAQGEGNPAGGFPRLAGQPAFYLERQMNAFADGRRDNPVMSPIAKAMNAQQRRDTSAWYATLNPKPAGAAAKADAVRHKRAVTLSTLGDDSKQVQACINCHGPNGAGEAPSYPYLAGQNATYLTAAMAEWKSGARKTDASGQMPVIAARLSDQDVAALSAYYAAQPAQAPALRTNVAAGSSAKPAVAARADAPGPRGGGGTQATQGVGTEQGAPLTGGNQGPGGGGGTQGNQPQQGGQPASRQQPAPPPKERR